VHLCVLGPRLPRQVYQRLGLVLARLCASAEDAGAVFAAAAGEGRYAAMLDSGCAGAAGNKLAADLTRDDARCLACLHSAQATGVFARTGWDYLEQLDSTLGCRGQIGAYKQLEATKRQRRGDEGAVVAANVRMAELLVALAAEPDQAPHLLSGCAWGLVLCSGFAPGPQQQQVWD
jgi:hypothetical protein